MYFLWDNFSEWVSLNIFVKIFDHNETESSLHVDPFPKWQRIKDLRCAIMVVMNVVVAPQTFAFKDNSLWILQHPLWALVGNILDLRSYWQVSSYSNGYHTHNSVFSLGPLQALLCWCIWGWTRSLNSTKSYPQLVGIVLP